MMKKSRWAMGTVLIVFLTFSLFFVGCDSSSEANTESAAAETMSTEGADSPFIGNESDEYYMLVFVTGAQFWKGCWDGFQAAGEQLGVKTFYTGCAEYDANAQVTVFEQVVAKKPKGILVCPVSEDAFREPINKAIEQGIMVSTFFIDVPSSNRVGYFGSDPIFEGEMAAEVIGQELNGEGEIAIIERPQQNVQMRITRFNEVLAEKYPGINTVASAYAEADETKAATATTSMIQANPNIKALVAFSAIEGVGAAVAKKESGKEFKIVTFEAEPAVLDYIKDGVITATIGQDSFSGGYWPMVGMYMAANKLIRPYTDWKQAGPFSPLPSYVNTGNNVITQTNVDHFYIEEW